MQRVEAYAIGDDVFINVAPPGSDRVLLEKVTNNGRAVPGLHTSFEWKDAVEIKKGPPKWTSCGDVVRPIRLRCPRSRSRGARTADPGR